MLQLIETQLSRMKNLILSILALLTWVEMDAQPIDAHQYIRLGNLEQSVWIRGSNTENPILLILHGGPGFSEAMFFRSYNKDLEVNFTVVNWDQRGAHLSYHDSIAPETMNIQQFVDDAHELIEVLKQRFNKRKIYLLGHSWGSVIGMNTAIQHPEDLHAYIGVGQVVNGKQNEIFSLDYTLAQATERGNKQAIDELQKLGKVYPKVNPESLEHLETQRKWLLEFGGLFYGNSDYTTLFEGVDKNEKSIYNETLAIQGEAFSMKHLWSEILSEVDFSKIQNPLRVPVYYIVGLSDFNTPFELTEKLYDHIDAPEKAIYRFEKSGHFIPFEEPQKFREIMEKILQVTQDN